MSLPFDLDAVRRLEGLAFAAWPALESRDVAGWRLRFSGGYTKRSSSINALGINPRVDDEIIGGLEGAYLERGQAPVWRLTPLAPSALSDRLGASAYRTLDRSVVQVAPLRPGLMADPEVRIQGEPTLDWLDAFATHSPVPAHHRDIMRRMLAAIAPPKGFAFVQHKGRPMAMAIGVVQGDHMGLFDVLVMPYARRRGLARRVTESLYAWAFAEGARLAYLQVVATNAAALALYQAQGFRTVYGYEYRIPAAP